MARPKTPSPAAEKRFVVRLLMAFNVCFCRVYQRITLRSRPQLPAEGSAILISNHTSGLDPMLIQAVCPRVIIWMMAKEYYDIPGLKLIFKAVEAIPVDRGNRDTAATRAALRALSGGRVLGVFPEGAIEQTTDLLPFHTGAALMAIRMKVPVYPVYLDGTQRGKVVARAVMTRNKAVLSFGPEIQFDRSDTSQPTLEAATARMQEALLALQSAQTTSPRTAVAMSGFPQGSQIH